MKFSYLNSMFSYHARETELSFTCKQSTFLVCCLLWFNYEIRAFYMRAFCAGEASWKIFSITKYFATERGRENFSIKLFRAINVWRTFRRISFAFICGNLHCFHIEQLKSFLLGKLLWNLLPLLRGCSQFYIRCQLYLKTVQ